MEINKLERLVSLLDLRMIWLVKLMVAQSTSVAGQKLKVKCLKLECASIHETFILQSFSKFSKATFI